MTTLLPVPLAVYLGVGLLVMAFAALAAPRSAWAAVERYPLAVAIPLLIVVGTLLWPLVLRKLPE